MALNDKAVAIGAFTKPIFRGETFGVECYFRGVVMGLLPNR